MPSPLIFKVYLGGEYRGATKYAEDAAALAGGTGKGSIIKYGGRIVWREGKEEFSASESYDGVRMVMFRRIKENWESGRRARPSDA